jgi:light-regulated signal transduction histidine kinase (bacteriophytochrome)
VKETSRLRKDYPEADDIKLYAGILYIPLSSKKEYFVALLRRQRLKSIRWAGDPLKHIRDEEGAIIVLEPRYHDWIY